MTTTSVSPTARSLWIGWRGVAAGGALILLTALVLALAAGGGSTAALDPKGVDPDGSRALAQLLGRHGVTVIRTEGVAAATGSAGQGDTLLVISPDLLDQELATELRSTGADLVLVGARNRDIVAAFLPGARVTGTAPVTARQPACDLTSARLAGQQPPAERRTSSARAAGRWSRAIPMATVSRPSSRSASPTDD